MAAQAWKDYIELNLPPDVDVFDLKDKWSKSNQKGLLDVQVVTAQRIRIKFDNRKFKKNEIAALVGGIEHTP